MFNLEQSIGRWRDDIQLAGINAETIAELESHLRETIDANRKQALPEQLAFENAVAQLGSPSQIITEFNRNRLFEKKLRNYKIEKIVGAFGLATYAGMSIYSLFFSNTIASTPWERVLGVLALVMTVGIAIGACYLWRIVPVIAVKKVRLLVGIASAVIGAAITAVLFLCILPKIEVTLSQLTVLILWSFFPMIAGTTVLVGLDEAADRRRQQYL
jgi:hypothetical protein